MTRIINAEDYGLPKRVQLIKLEVNKIAIVRRIKSRIIMKDGVKILEIAKSIWRVDNQQDIALLISGPICSKTRKYLEENKVEIIAD